MSNVIPLVKPGLSIKEIYPVVDELADAMFKVHGLEKCGFSLAVAYTIADTILERKGFEPLSSQPFDLMATLINVVRFRLAVCVLQLNDLSELYDLAEIAAKHGLLPIEELAS